MTIAIGKWGKYAAGYVRRWQSKFPVISAQTKQMRELSPEVCGPKWRNRDGRISRNESERAQRGIFTTGSKSLDGSCDGRAGSCSGAGLRLRLPATTPGRPPDGAGVGGEFDDQPDARGT